MEKTALHEIFLRLVRLGVGHDLVSGFKFQVSSSLSAEDWQAVEDLANEQGLLGVVADGIEQLKVKSEELKVDCYLPPKPVMLQMIGQVLQNYEYRHELYRKAIGELAGFYNRHGFKMMVLKGYACALDWPRPEHRPSGDIDIWLFGEQVAADKALGSWFKAQGSKSEIDNSHHHHTVFFWRDFMVENHYDFINVHARRSNVRLERIFKELGDEKNVNLKPETWNLKPASPSRGTQIPWVEVCGERVYLPSANLHALFLVRHMVAHFAAAEITLRQVLDWAFFVEKHGSEVDWPWLVETLEEFGLKGFFDVVNAICVEELGFGHTESTESTESSDAAGFKCQVDGGSVDEALRRRVLRDILEPEFHEEVPQRLLPRVWFRYRRWQANAWKQRLCYSNESRWSAFWSGVWNHLLKPGSV